MINSGFIQSIILTSMLTFFSLTRAQGQANDSITSEERYQRYLKFYKLVRGVNVRPHWYADENRFWFAAGTPDSTVIYEVNASRNTKTELFNNQRLRGALKQLLAHEPPNKGIPFTDFEFAADSITVQFKVEGQSFRLNLKSYKISSVGVSPDAVLSEPQLFSPDGKQFAFVRDNNLWLGGKTSPKPELLTDDGIKDYRWDMPTTAWSPDGSFILVQKTDERKVHQLPVVNYSTPLEEVEWSPYAKTGGALEINELFIVDIKNKRQIKIDVGNDTAQYIFPLG